MKRAKSKSGEPRTKLQPRRVVARWAAFLSIVCGIVGYSLSRNAYDDPTKPYHTVGFVMQNFGVLLIVMQAVFAWVLKRAQYGVYWFWWLQIQNVKPDERQVAVRQRVFVRAYGTAVILMVLFSQGAIQAFVHYANPARDDLIARALWALGIFLISLPSILAAWEKDS